MRVGISGLAVSNPGGLGRLARTSILALASVRPEWELHVYLRSRDDVLALEAECDSQSFALVDSLHLHFPPPAWRARLMLEEFDLPRQFKPLGLDAYLGLDFTLPTRKLAPIEAVIIPDLLPFTQPKTVSMRARLLYRGGIRRAIERDARLVCISEVTRQQLLLMCREGAPSPSAPADASQQSGGRQGGPPTTVVLPVLSPRLGQLAEASQVHDRPLQVRGTHYSVTDPGRYLLYVGDNGPRKNVALLCNVFRTMVERGEYAGSLILAGGDGKHGTAHPGAQLALQAIGPNPEAPERSFHIYDLGRVSDIELSELYANADLLVNLSSEEGFGYPVLEAIAHGTPAVVTKGSAMEECAPAGIIPTSLEPNAVAGTITSSVTALPLLRQEVHAIDRGWFNIERMGEQLAQVLE